MNLKLFFVFLFFAQLALSQVWTQLPDFPGLPSDDGVAVSLNNTAYVGTGLQSDLNCSSNFYALDKSTNTWQPIGSMPVGMQYACAFTGAGGFFVLGGTNAGGALNSLYKYEAATSQTWSVMAPKPGNAVVGAVCLEFGDKVIIVGGKAQSSALPNSEVWEYTISSNSWQQKTNFPFGGRFRASGAVLNGTGYLLFGADNNNHFRKQLYAYNPTSDSWNQLSDFPQPAARVYTALKAVNNTLILFGGIDSTLTCYKDVWYYHVQTDSWTQGNDLPSFARKGGMSTVIGTTFYYCCGIDQNNNRLKETWMTDVPVGITKNAAPLSFTLFPNPAQHTIMFRSEMLDHIRTISLTDLSGESLTQPDIDKINNALWQIHIPKLDEGIYFLKLERTDGVVEWKRFVKE